MGACHIHSSKCQPTVPYAESPHLQAYEQPHSQEKDLHIATVLPGTLNHMHVGMVGLQGPLGLHLAVLEVGALG
jgi:hypothetical protein